MVYGYARVSARDQNLDRQLAEFEKLGVETVFCDKQSGKDFDRKQYKALLGSLQQGDLLIAKSIDRLGRNYDEIIAQWDWIVNKVQADIFVADMPLLDTRVKKDTLIGKFVSDIVLQVLSFVAQNERENIKRRQAEGIAVARKRGVKFGRPRGNFGKQFENVLKQYKSGKLTQEQAAFLCGISRQGFAYRANALQQP